MTPRTIIKTFFYSLVAAVLAHYALRVHQDPLRALTFLLVAVMPWCVRQHRTAMYGGLGAAMIAPLMPMTGLCLVIGLWLLFLLLPRVSVPPSKADMAELKQAAAKSRETQDLGNVRVMPSGATYTVDKHGSWRRVRAQG